jgi:endoglucanase
MASIPNLQQLNMIHPVVSININININSMVRKSARLAVTLMMLLTAVQTIGATEPLNNAGSDFAPLSAGPSNNSTISDGHFNNEHSTKKDTNRMNRFKRGISIGHWLAKFDETQGYGGDWFGEQDIRWLAQQGFDHLRFPVDGRLWVTADGSLDEARVAVFDRALQLTKTHGMAVVLDMHFLPGGTYNANAQDPRLFTDATERKKAADFLKKVTQRFSAEGPELRFELINEPMAPSNEQLNQLNADLINAVRIHDKNRVLYITSNLSSTFETLTDVRIPQDPNIALLLHYDEPSVFTHQRTSWKNYPDKMPEIHFPGKVPDLSSYLPKDHYAYSTSNTELTEQAVFDDFAKAQAWIEKNAPGKEVYLGAFGVYQKAPEESRRRYLKTVRTAAETYSWGWCIWDYKSSFGIRPDNDKPAETVHSLFDKH